MLLVRDKIHYFFNRVDGYNKMNNYIISSRDVGKTTAWVIDKAYRPFKKYGLTCLIVNRHNVDITPQYILTIQNEINKFEDENVVITYRLSDLKNGVVSLYIDDRLFGMIVSLSIDIRRIKLLKLRNIGVIVFDEFIINPKYKERYLEQEVDKFKELYDTFKRDYLGKGFLKVYFCGNPYTRYNPYFMDTGVDLSRIIQGTVVTGDTWAIESYRMTDELYEIIKAKNPQYNRDDAYTNYALNGVSVNDEGIRLGKLKNNFKLFTVCEIGGRRIGIFRNSGADQEVKYHCQPINYDNMNRDIYVFNIEDLLYGNNVLVGPEDSMKFIYFRLAYRRNKITYSDIATYYDVKEVYNYI